MHEHNSANRNFTTVAARTFAFTVHRQTTLTHKPFATDKVRNYFYNLSVSSGGKNGKRRLVAVPAQVAA